MLFSVKMYPVVGLIIFITTQIYERNGTSMVTNNPTAVLRSAHFRHRTGFMGHAIVAPNCGQHVFGVMVGASPLTIGLAQGRIMSISRGLPPPKKR